MLKYLLIRFLLLVAAFKVCAQDDQTSSPADSIYVFMSGNYDHIKPAVKIKEVDFNEGFINDPIQLIQGRVAGLSIVKPGGNPNEAFDLRLRGLNTFNGRTTPLIVVDGIPDASPENYDPNDIESFEVLKDASATALYGIRGANGVIIIHTKHGGGGMQIEYNGYGNAEIISKTQKVLNASEWRDFSNEINRGTDFLNSTDWQKEITRTAYSQAHNLAVSGGNHLTSYRMSLNYRGVQGVAIHTGFKQMNGLFSLSQKALKDKLTASINFGGTYRTSQPGFDDVFLYANIFNPTAPVRVEQKTSLPNGYSPDDFDQWNGYFNQYLFYYYNPVQILNEDKYDAIDTKYYFSGKLSYQFLPRFKIDAVYSLQSTDNFTGLYYARTSLYGGSSRNGYAERSYAGSSNQFFQTALQWSNRADNPLLVSAEAGYAYQEFIHNGFDASGGNFLTDFFKYNRLSAAKDFADGLGDVTSYKNSNRIIGFYGTADFTWKKIYSISTVVRYDGSSRLGINHKWGCFPGVNASVELSQFLNINNIQSLKFRLGYGITGNNLPSDNLSIKSFDISGGAMYYNGKYIPAYTLLQDENRDLKWETKREFNAGVYYSMFENNVYGSIEFYNNDISDIVQQFYIPNLSNYPEYKWTNGGKLKNSGLEFSLNWDVIHSASIRYRTGIIYSRFIKNEIVSLSGGEPGLTYGPYYDRDAFGFGGGRIPVIRIEEGKPVGQFIGLVFKEIDTNGNKIFADVNHDGYANGGYDDRTIIGNAMPKASLGFSHIFNYKNWELDVFFRGMFGHDLINYYRDYFEKPYLISSYNIPESAMQLKNKSSGAYYGNTGGMLDDSYVENGSYLRLDNLRIAYKMRISKSNSELTFYLAGNNLFVITSYTGPDPEVRFQSEGNPLTPGVDDATSDWPLTRSVSIGINLKLH